MKINPFMTILSLLMSALIGYALFEYCKEPDLRWLLTIAGGIGIFLTWGTTLAVSLEDKRATANLKVLSGICALVMTALQCVFAFAHIRPVSYALITGLVLFVWLAAAYPIAKSGKGKE